MSPRRDPEEIREAHRLSERKRRMLYPERVEEIRRRSRAKNHEKELAYSKKRYIENREAALLYAARYRAEHPEKVADILRRSRQKHKDRVRVEWTRKQVKRRGAQGSHTAKERSDLFASYHGLCVYCCGPAATLDHITPLARGGTNYIENCVPACLSCNSRKRVTPLMVWLVRRVAA